jgi:hydrogenase/urease accessory protein HupE
MVIVGIWSVYEWPSGLGDASLFLSLSLALELLQDRVVTLRPALETIVAASVVALGLCWH